MQKQHDASIIQTLGMCWMDR
ncbi:Protein CBG25553 [Caenorhabditis briggsae]|uniref:Protein CBG25553 n=1 Tax=Caenorhabditis briggsae TaxID=6238 RepID=B6IF40_CAEBR|nr:Protein CBG25553 [Caenorhabditis briggsae]CAR98520.1 Protein CBG25553 [Caenorhabditis briggsae]